LRDCCAFEGWKSGTDKKIIAVFFEGTLKVGLKPRDPYGGELPIVADLTTTHESARGLCVGASKTTNRERARASRNGNRGYVKVGLNIAEAGPGAHASVPTGPVIDGRGCGRRSLDGHISRKSRPAHNKDESGQDEKRSDPLGYGRLLDGLTVLPPRGRENSADHRTFRKLPACVAL
jgi:hypothetical protein